MCKIDSNAFGVLNSYYFSYKDCKSMYWFSKAFVMLIGVLASKYFAAQL
jgi:hypothetical protein